MFPGASFMLDGMCHTITNIEPGKVWCEREDGRVLALNGYEQPEEWKRRSVLKWFTKQAHAAIP